MLYYKRLVVTRIYTKGDKDSIKKRNIEYMLKRCSKETFSSLKMITTDLFICSVTSRLACWIWHSHKKWKDSQETRAERVALCAYVENQAILEPILLECA